MTDEGNVSRARRAGAEAVASLRRTLAGRAAELIVADPEAARLAVQVGLVDAAWLADPSVGPNLTGAPAEVVSRFLERAVEARPSRLGKLGLGTARLLATLHADGRPPTVRQVAVVFTDLEGFTAFTAAAGDAAAVELLADHHRRAAAAVAGSGGTIVKHLGDGLMCTFPSPALAVLGALELVASPAGGLAVRAGGNLGEAVTTPTDVIGHAVNVAARVTEEAPGGQLLVTAPLADASGALPGVTYGPERLLALKGIDGPVAVRDVRLDRGRLVR